MNPTSILYLTLRALNDSMKGALDGTKIESIKETINRFAIASALASMAAGVIPGAAGVAAALTQAGFVWATYVKINKTLGISMSEHTAKFLGSAIVTNIVTNAGAMLMSYAAAAILAFVPLIGQAAAAAISGALGYIIIYVAAIIYLKLISNLIQPDGTLKVEENDDTKHIIQEIIKKNNIEDIIKEGRSSYKKAKADGSLKLKCPVCNTKFKPGQEFCTVCGRDLTLNL